MCVLVIKYASKQVSKVKVKSCEIFRQRRSKKNTWLWKRGFSVKMADTSAKLARRNYSNVHYLNYVLNETRTQILTKILLTDEFLFISDYNKRQIT